MSDKKEWFYDYENKCDCSEDDSCGCSYPNNMAHGFDYKLQPSKINKHKPMNNLSEINTQNINI